MKREPNTSTHLRNLRTLDTRRTAREPLNADATVTVVRALVRRALRKLHKASDVTPYREDVPHYVDDARAILRLALEAMDNGNTDD